MENKKIRNATEVTYDGITFKSKLECSLYKVLKEEGFNVSYEKDTFILIPGFRPTVTFYKRSKSRVFKLDLSKIRPVTYTPDFTIDTDNGIYFIEAKGIENDVYPLKRKLFRKYLEENSLDKYTAFFEVHTKKELLQVITIIKDYEKKLKGYKLECK